MTTHYWIMEDCILTVEEISYDLLDLSMSRLFYHTTAGLLYAFVDSLANYATDVDIHICIEAVGGVIVCASYRNRQGGVVHTDSYLISRYEYQIFLEVFVGDVNIKDRLLKLDWRQVGF